MRILGLSGVRSSMRLGVTCGVALCTIWPATARAEGSSLALTSLRALASQAAATEAEPEPEPEPDPDSVASPPQPTSSKAPPSSLQPTSSKAPPSAAPVSDPVGPSEDEGDALEPIAAEEGEAEEITLETERRLAARNDAFRHHAIGAHGGIVVIPTWLLSNWLATHTNALCRGKIGNFAADRGLQQQDGCNFYVGADYTYRFSRVLDVAASVQYQRAKVPDGLWLDKSRYNGTAGSIEAADYTEIDMGLIAMEVDFIARAPIVVTENVEFGLGGGAGLGLGVVLGDVHQTPLGTAPAGFTPGGGRTDGTCQTIEDLADLTRCTPRWDPSNDGDDVPPNESDLSSPNPDLFANCTSTECNDRDLAAFGYRMKQGGIPPVIPVVNLILSARIIIKDTVGITVNGGFNTGFYFGGGLQYYFGKPEVDEVRRKPTASRRKTGRSGRV